MIKNKGSTLPKLKKTINLSAGTKYETEFDNFYSESQETDREELELEIRRGRFKQRNSSRQSRRARFSRRPKKRNYRSLVQKKN